MACTCGKRSLADEMEAISECLRLSAKRGVGLRFYACPHGAGFHLTKRPSFDGPAPS